MERSENTRKQSFVHGRVAGAIAGRPGATSGRPYLGEGPSSLFKSFEVSAGVEPTSGRPESLPGLEEDLSQ